jgi:hypothetical protein
MLGNAEGRMQREQSFILISLFGMGSVLSNEMLKV